MLSNGSFSGFNLSLSVQFFAAVACATPGIDQPVLAPIGAFYTAHHGFPPVDFPEHEAAPISCEEVGTCASECDTKIKIVGILYDNPVPA
eukprot:1465366-Amphidinium_carterae.1